MNKLFSKLCLQLLVVLLLLLLTNCAKRVVHPVEMEYALTGVDEVTIQAYRGTYNFLRDCIENKNPVKVHPRTRIDTVVVDAQSTKADIFLTAPFGYIPLRESRVDSIYQKLRLDLGKQFQDYEIRVHAGDYSIDELIPNYFRQNIDQYDSTRLSRPEIRGVPLIRNLNVPWQPTAGLYNRNIALWPR